MNSGHQAGCTTTQGVAVTEPEPVVTEETASEETEESVAEESSDGDDSNA